MPPVSTRASSSSVCARDRGQELAVMFSCRVGAVPARTEAHARASGNHTGKLKNIENYHLDFN